MSEPMLKIDNLTVDIAGPAGTVRALDAVSMMASAGEVVGLVGESGGGKSMIARSLVGLLPRRATATGKIDFMGTDVLTLGGEALRAHRGDGIALCFQTPRASLCATRTVGRQIEDRLRDRAGENDLRDPLALLRQVGLLDAERIARSFPHELSGGMAQRVMIALTLACQPRLIVADEPTTGLDVTLTGEILGLIAAQTAGDKRAVIIISHDLAALARVCQRLVVLEKGRVVEQGPTTRIIAEPAHPYTRKLIDAVPDIARGAGSAKPAVAPPPLLSVRDLDIVYRGRFGAKGHHAVKGISFDLHSGETIGIVGESGSGKSTLSRAMMGLMQPTRGTIVFDGVDLARQSRAAMRALRARMQMIFQDPVDSLNPRMSVEQIVSDPLRLTTLSAAERSVRIDAILADVGLGSEYRKRRPHELSGGQAQRVGIARALVIDPAMVVLDEPTSALDVTVQAQILDLIGALTRRNDRAYAMISHDLATVRAICDRVMVIDAGRICEMGPTEQVFSDPRSEVTRKLLAAVPRLHETSSRQNERHIHG